MDEKEWPLWRRREEPWPATETGGEMKEDTASTQDGHKGCADAKLPNI